MDALASERVQVTGQRRDQRFSFTSSHFGDPAAVQNDAADELDIEVPHVKDAAAGLTANGEGFDQQVVERFAVFNALLEVDGFLGQFGVGELLERGFEIVNGGDHRTEPLDFAFVPGPENFRKSGVEHGQGPGSILADLANCEVLSGWGSVTPGRIVARMTVRMLLRHVKLENLLSFRNTEVEFRGLNVLIGANASGKSNLIEAIGLLQAAPIDLSAAIRRLGGVRVVCSLAGSQYSPIAVIECHEINNAPLKYRLEFSEEARGFIILREHLSKQGTGQKIVYFDRFPSTVEFDGKNQAEVSRTESVFERYKIPTDTTPITSVGRSF